MTRQKNITLALSLLILLLVGLLAWQLYNKPSAPNIAFTTLDQTKLNLHALRGKTVMVNFWATSCPGCVAEMPQLVKTWQQYHAQGFEIVAVAMQYDDLATIQHFVSQHQLPFIVTYDAQGQISQAFGQVTVTPTAFVIDPAGKLIQKSIGEFNFATLHQQLQQAAL